MNSKLADIDQTPDMDGGEQAKGYRFIFVCDKSGSVGDEIKAVVKSIENSLNEQ